MWPKRRPFSASRTDDELKAWKIFPLKDSHTEMKAKKKVFFVFPKPSERHGPRQTRVVFASSSARLVSSREWICATQAQAEAIDLHFAPLHRESKP
jgi:hypothetical protein